MWGNVGGVFFHLEQDHASFPEESHATQFYITSRWVIKSFSVLWVVFEGNSFCLERMLARHLNTSSSNHLTGTYCSSFGVAIHVFETPAQVVQNLPKKLPSHIQQRTMNCTRWTSKWAICHWSSWVWSCLFSHDSLGQPQGKYKT